MNAYIFQQVFCISVNVCAEDTENTISVRYPKIIMSRTMVAEFVIAVTSILLIPVCMIYCKRLAYATMGNEQVRETISDPDRNHKEIVKKLVIKVSPNAFSNIGLFILFRLKANWFLYPLILVGHILCFLLFMEFHC